ncbi:MAG: DUF721 domain-containing protein [Candidatus Omnitrophica bacterium]|nr:DUF721 domain-containing protein [Candidatus Omnitrophota bacterium]
MGKNSSLGDSIKKIISGLRKEKGEDFLAAWESAAGEGASKHTKINFLKQGRLVVSVSNSSWLYRLTLEKQNILEKLNRTQNRKVKELQFRIGDTG